MRNCLGNNQGKYDYLKTIEGWHGKYGHVNVYKLDHDSIITSYGKHDRVMAYLPQYDAEYNSIVFHATVSHCWELGVPDDTTVLKVSKANQDFKGRFKLLEKVYDAEGYNGYPCTYYVFKKE